MQLAARRRGTSGLRYFNFDIGRFGIRRFATSFAGWTPQQILEVAVISMGGYVYYYYEDLQCVDSSDGPSPRAPVPLQLPELAWQKLLRA